MEILDELDAQIDESLELGWEGFSIDAVHRYPLLYEREIICRRINVMPEALGNHREET
jgi:hypothetical protein